MAKYKSESAIAAITFTINLKLVIRNSLLHKEVSVMLILQHQTILQCHTEVCFYSYKVGYGDQAIK